LTENHHAAYVSFFKLKKALIIGDEKLEIIRRFNENVRGKVTGIMTTNSGHNGKDGHWLEQQMGVKANASNSPDLFGYEMKNQTTSKTTFGDWSADYYIYKDIRLGIGRDNGFLTIFGKPNIEKGNRFSWSGEPCPKINSVNSFGQTLIVDSNNNIIALYSFSKDTRVNKTQIVPVHLQIDNLILAKWDAASISAKLERKFNQKGWFKCIKNKQGIYSEIAFGNAICFAEWIKWVKTGDVFFDSGMFQGNSRNYSQWRANNSFWDKLIYERY
jgi:hypothetical protein